MRAALATCREPETFRCPTLAALFAARACPEGAASSCAASQLPLCHPERSMSAQRTITRSREPALSEAEGYPTPVDTQQQPDGVGLACNLRRPTIRLQTGERGQGVGNSQGETPTCTRWQSKKRRSRWSRTSEALDEFAPQWSKEASVTVDQCGRWKHCAVTPEPPAMSCSISSCPIVPVGLPAFPLGEPSEPSQLSTATTLKTGGEFAAVIWE